MCTSTVSLERKAKLFDAILKELSGYFKGSEILTCLEGGASISSLLYDRDVGDFFREAFKDLDLGDDELEDMLLPHLEGAINNSLATDTLVIRMTYEVKESS